MPDNPIYISFVRPVNEDSVSKLLDTVNRAIFDKFYNIILLMNSAGGIVSSGVAAFNQLKALPINITTYNIGNVGSIATLLFLAGNTRIAVPNSTFFFHLPYTTMQGDFTAQQLRERAFLLECDDKKIRDSMLSALNIPTPEFEGLFTKQTLNTQSALAVNVIQDIAPLNLGGDDKIIQI